MMNTQTEEGKAREPEWRGSAEVMAAMNAWAEEVRRVFKARLLAMAGKMEGGSK